MRRILLGALAAGAVALVGAVVLGEFAFNGWTVLISAGVLGLATSEAAVSVARVRSSLLAVVTAAATAAALVAAGWVSTGHQLAALAPSAWLAIATGTAIAAVRAGRPMSPASSPRGTSPSPSHRSEPGPEQDPFDPDPRCQES